MADVKRSGRRKAKTPQSWKVKWPDKCRKCDGWADARHHVVYEQHVRKEGGRLFDLRNGLPLCYDCHVAHHRGGENRLNTRLLFDGHIEFAVELLGPDRAYNYFHRYYHCDEDARVEALLQVAPYRTGI
jgi:hypothetical protein